MKYLFHLLVALFFVLMFCFQAADACTIVINPSLRKDFRLAKDVFLGEIVSVEKKDKFYTTTFKVKKSWKGNDSKEIAVEALNHCACPRRSFDFQVGKQFLVMTVYDEYDEKPSFTPCMEYAFQIDENSERAKKVLKRLDNSWFRAWAKIYPF